MEKNLHRNSFSHKVNIIINITLIITLATLNFIQIIWWAQKEYMKIIFEVIKEISVN